MDQKTSNIGTWHTVFVATKESLTRMVSKLVPPKEIEDIVQETYVRICQLECEDKIEKPKSFLMKTARNLALDYNKKAETRLSDHAETENDYLLHKDENDEVYAHIASNNEFAEFCEAVRQLPQQCRRVFVLKKVYGYSQKEIAKDMNISQSTVEKHISQGLRRCTMHMMNLQKRNRLTAQEETLNSFLTQFEGANK
ncbi:RNA polymerase sigma factor [Glaciecola sp. KUL10]|uniref:RNA polymerase sigma factor n=1 Tax=Glaciecola sp. (strain KUL10) TaxID=2161813 RepID=UPI000D78A16F|nr:sigma-70 family RNA polymerase sigma factor [Glaciecola sp. KUL10]GBL04349.1 RNA polymerase sigma-70 factor, ECF subfamily [Glaciecola sp. KUL10]